MDKKLLRLLVIDDSPDDAELATEALRRAGYMVKSQRVQDLAGAQAVLSKGVWDVVISEFDVPQISVPSVVELLKRLKLDLPVIVMTRTISDDELIGLMRSGARDVVFKNQTGRLGPVIEREIHVSETRRAEHQAQQAFTELQQKYEALIQGSHEAVGYLQDGMHVEANPAYLALFGYDDLKALQEIPVLNLIDSADQARFKALMRKPDQRQAGGFTVVKRDGTRTPVEIAISMIDMGGESWMQVSVSDMSRHKNIEGRLQFLNQRDQLTGLYNRHHFLQELNKAVETAKAGKGTSAMLYIDLERLKEINTAHGFAAGDRMLIKLARLFREQTGNQDVLARFAGDEFAILLPDADAKRAKAVADAVKKALGETSFTEGGKQYHCGCSLNYVVIDANTENAQKIVMAAHRAATTQAAAPPPKAATPPAPVVAPPAPVRPAVEPPAPATKLSPWAITIQNALEHEGFQLLFQPIINLHGDPVESYEVLLRLKSDEAGTSSVGELFRGAVECGKAQAIDHWVVKRAIATLGEHRKTGAKTKFFINLSDAALRDETLALLVLQEIKGTGLKADSLIFEISESALADSPRDAAAFVDSLRKLGCGFCVDDFGNRLSAYPEIQKLPIDFLKLNGRLITNLANDPVAQTVVQALFQMAKAMQRRIIAKFVEDAESVALLWNYGADYVQGNYFQPPEPGLNYEFAGESIDSDQAVGGWTSRR